MPARRRRARVRVRKRAGRGNGLLLAAAKRRRCRHLRRHLRRHLPAAGTDFRRLRHPLPADRLRRPRRSGSEAERADENGLLRDADQPDDARGGHPPHRRAGQGRGRGHGGGQHLPHPPISSARSSWARTSRSTRRPNFSAATTTRAPDCWSRRTHLSPNGWRSSAAPRARRSRPSTRFSSSAA